MADTKKTVEILFEGTDKASVVIDKLGGKLDNFGSGISDIASPFESITSSVLKLEAALGALAVGGMALAYSKSVDFDSALVGLKKVLGDVSEGEIDNLRTEILKLSDDYGVASTAVTESITGWKQAGFETAEALGLVKNALDLKIAGDLTAAQSTETLTSILKGFRFEAEEAGRAVDVINEVSNKYATDSRQLGIALGDLSPIAKTMGFTLEEAAGLVTPVIEVFRSGSEASTSLRTGLLKLVDDAAPVQEALAKLGVSQKDANGEMRSGKDIFYDVAEAFKTLDENQKLVITSQLVGTEQAARMMTVFNDLAKVQNVTADAMKSSGSAAAEVAARMQSSQVVVDKFKESFNNLAIELGNNFRPSIDNVIKGFTDVEKAIAEASKSGAFDDLYKAFESFSNETEQLLKGIAESLPEALSNVDFSVLTESLSGLGDSMSGIFEDIFGDVDLTTPEGLESVIQDVVDAMAGLQDVVSGIVDSFGPFVSLISEAIEYFSDLSPETRKTAGEILGLGTQLGIVAGLMSGSGLFISGIGQTLGAMSKLGSAAIDTGKGIGKFAAEIQNNSKYLGTFQSATGRLSAALGTGGLVLAAGSAGYAIGTLINQIPGVQSAVQGLFGFVDDFINAEENREISIQAKLDEEAFEKAKQLAAERIKQTEAESQINIEAEVTAITDKAKEDLDKLGSSVAYLSDEEFKNISIGVDADTYEAEKNILAIDNKLKELQEGKARLIELQTNGRDVTDELKLVDDRINELTSQKKKLSVETDSESIAKTKQEFETLSVFLEDGTEVSIQVPIDQESKEKTKKELQEIVPPDKQLELQVELDIAAMQANAEQFEAQMEALQTSVEWKAKLDIAEVEANAEIVTSAFESINTTIQSTGDVLSGLFGLLGEDLGFSEKWAVFDQIEKENELRERAVKMQEELTSKQIEVMDAWLEAKENGEPMKIEVAADGLKPHLENVLYELLGYLQEKIVLEGGDMLIPIASAT